MSMSLFVNNDRNTSQLPKKQVAFQPNQLKEDYSRLQDVKHSRRHSMLSPKANVDLNPDKENTVSNCKSSTDIKSLNKTLEGLLSALEIPIPDKSNTIDLLKVIESEFEYLLAENRFISSQMPKFFSQKRREYHTLQMKEPLELQLLTLQKYQNDRMKRSAIRAQQASSRKIVRHPLDRVYDKQSSRKKMKTVEDTDLLSDKIYFEE